MSRYSKLYVAREGHKFFSVAGKPHLLAVCDDSGETPAEADDGPLMVDKASPIVLTHDNVMCYHATDEEGREVSLIAPKDEAAYLMSRHGMKLKVGELTLPDDLTSASDPPAMHTTRNDTWVVCAILSGGHEQPIGTNSGEDDVPRLGIFRTRRAAMVDIKDLVDSWNNDPHEKGTPGRSVYRMADYAARRLTPELYAEWLSDNNLPATLPIEYGTEFED